MKAKPLLLAGHSSRIIAAMIDESFLKDVFLFKTLTDSENHHVCSLLKEEKFKQGQTILEEGRPGDALYIIWAGRVRVSRRFDKESFILTELGPHDFFGEMSLIDDFPTSATVDAIEDTTLFKMNREDFRSITSQHNDLSSKLWESLARCMTIRIRKTGDLVKLYYGLSKALCENEQFRELYTSWNFHAPKSGSLKS
ncbi:MAG: cyclic nucleotide-binding domain-containing protein, partial [Acidobacteriota bacterium]